jgi:hypothetical protein
MLTGRGASRAEVSIRRHALRVAPALRRARHPHLKLRVDVRLAEGAVQRRTVGLRVVRRP